MKFPLFLTTLNVSRLVIIGSYLFFLLLLHHHIHSIFSIIFSITIFAISDFYLLSLSSVFYLFLFMFFIFYLPF